MLPVLIPTPSPDLDSVARRALRCEGVKDLIVHPVVDALDYGRMLAYFWTHGDGFILIEDDMAPWPGAIDQLRDCPLPWCRFDYSIGFGRMGAGTLGCMKFSAELLAAAPGLWARWDGTPWQQLDAALVAAVASIGPPIPRRAHVHEPAIAHAKHYRKPTR